MPQLNTHSGHRNIVKIASGCLPYCTCAQKLAVSLSHPEVSLNSWMPSNSKKLSHVEVEKLERWHQLYLTT